MSGTVHLVVDGNVARVVLSNPGRSRHWSSGGITAAYHGDFDAAGIDIMNRIHQLGVAPWRIAPREYLEAAVVLSALNSRELTAAPADWETIW